MGLFSSKRKTYVGSSSSRLVEDLMVPNSILAGATRAILKDGDISQGVINELSKSIGVRARSMYSYGRNNYVFGTPDAEIQTSVSGATELLAVLQSLYVGEVVLNYHHIGAPNILHIARMKLIQDHSYDPQTNQLGLLTTSTGLPVFVHDLVVVLPQATAALYEPAAIEQWGSAPTRGTSPTRPSYTVTQRLSSLAHFTPVESAAVAEDYVRVEYAWTTVANAVQRGSFNIGNSEFAEDADFFQVGFTVDGVQKYWMYQAGAETYPSLDALMATGVGGQAVGTFFPFIHFRSNKQSIAANPLSTESVHSVKMAKKLGINYMELHDAIHENPGIGDIAQAYLGVMVPITSTNEVDSRYLFDFFTALHSTGLGVAPLPVLTDDVSRASRQETHRAAVQIRDTKVRHTLSCTGIVKKLQSGDLLSGLEYESGYLAMSESQKHHFFKRQLTPSVYEEIQVFGLEMRYWIDGDYSAVGDEVDAELLIPVDYSISRTYPMQVQEVLYARSLRLITNSSVTVTVKWYQQSWFATFITVVGIVMSAFTFGTSAGFAAALAAGVAAVVQFVLIAILVNLAIAYAFTLFVELVGVDLAIVVAVLAAVYGSAQALQSSLKTAMPTLASMLQVATGLVKASAKVVMDDLLELGEEFAAFKDEAQEQMKLLDETKKLLENSTRMDPLVIFGETPDNYYNRTVHSGNVGTIGYQAIESYVSMALTLPTISDTLGGA